MVPDMDGKPTQSPYIIALCQQKGGVGKTTTAACLGAGLAQSGKNVLLLDLAPSGNLTASFGINLNRVKRSTTISSRALPTHQPDQAHDDQA